MTLIVWVKSTHYQRRSRAGEGFRAYPDRTAIDRNEIDRRNQLPIFRFLFSILCLSMSRRWQVIKTIDFSHPLLSYPFRPSSLSLFTKRHVTLCSIDFPRSNISCQSLRKIKSPWRSSYFVSELPKMRSKECELQTMAKRAVKYFSCVEFENLELYPIFKFKEFSQY